MKEQRAEKTTEQGPHPAPKLDPPELVLPSQASGCFFVQGLDPHFTSETGSHTPDWPETHEIATAAPAPSDSFYRLLGLQGCVSTPPQTEASCCTNIPVPPQKTGSDSTLKLHYPAESKVWSCSWGISTGVPRSRRGANEARWLAFSCFIHQLSIKIAMAIRSVSLRPAWTTNQV